jgi:hypothetical protein
MAYSLGRVDAWAGKGPAIGPPQNFRTQSGRGKGAASRFACADVASVAVPSFCFLETPFV